MPAENERMRKAYEEYQNTMKKIRENLLTIKNRVVVFSGKGGVGKTMFSINLAYALSEFHNKKVGLLDADITSPNIPKMLGLSGSIRAENDKLIPLTYKDVSIISTALMIKDEDALVWRGPLRSKLINQFLGETAWNVDVLVADLPPGTGDEVLTITQSMRPNIAIIVTTPQEVSIADARRAVVMAKKMNIKVIGVVENMSYLKCPSCGAKIDVFGSGGGVKVADEQSVEFFGALPLDVKARAMTEESKIPVLEECDFSKEFQSVVVKILKFFD